MSRNRMARSRRRGALNKSLVVVLGVVGVLAAGFWTYQISTAERAPKVEWTPTEPTSIYCSSCGKVMMVEPADFVKLERDKKTSAYRCPNCKEFNARVSYGPPARVSPPEGETKP